MQVFQLTEKAIWYGEMSFSPDGRWLGLSGKPFTLVDTTQGRKPEELPLGDFRRGFAFVRGGAAIAYLPGGTLLREYELTTQQVRECEVQNGHPLSIASDPSGETLYLS